MDIKAAIFGANMAISELTANGQIGDIERKAIVCFPETEYALSGGTYLGIPGTPFENGDAVTATYDGVEYERKAAVFPYENFARGYYVGNLSVLGGEDTGEPFAILSTYGDEDNEFLGFIVLDVNEFGSEGDSTHRVGCSTIAETVKTIDPKYVVKEVDFSKFHTDGVSENLGELLFNMAGASLQAGGALQEMKNVDYVGLKKALSTTRQIVAVMPTPYGTVARFPLAVSLYEGVAANVSSYAYVWMDAVVETKNMFVFHNDPADEGVTIYVQAKVIT